MTANLRAEKKAHPQKMGKTVFGLLGIFFLLLILRNSEIAIDYMSRGLTLCAKTVIPSLFPFMVLAEMIVSGGFGALLLQRLSKPLERLFHLSPSGCCAVLLGMLCGSPIGARCAVLGLEQGTVTKEEAERVISFSNVPSSAFLISAVGGSLWGNAGFGVALYLSVLLSSLITGICLAHLPRAKCYKSADLTAVQNLSRNPVPVFCDAIRTALGNMLLVCAYVVFFSALLGTVQFLPLVQKMPEAAKAFLFCTFEISSGVSHASALKIPLQAALLTAAGVGWSGLSVHFQILSLCEGSGISFRLYFFSKLLQAALCAILLGIMIRIHPALLFQGVVC